MTLLWGSVGKQRKITRTHCHWLTLWNIILCISFRTAWDRFDLSPSFWSCNIETHNWVFIVSKTQLIFLLKNFASTVPILNPDLSILNWTTPSNVTEICMFLHIFFFFISCTENTCISSLKGLGSWNDQTKKVTGSEWLC